MFKLTIYMKDWPEEPKPEPTKTEYEKGVDIAADNMRKAIDDDIIATIHADATPSTFTMYIYPYELPPRDDMEYQEIETQRTGIDVEKYDKADPELFVAEVNNMIADGKDYKCCATIGDTVGMTVSQSFFHHLNKVREKRQSGRKPSFWNIRLANVCVMHLRCGLESVQVECNSNHIVKGYVCDAAPDGTQVRLLFKIPPQGYDKYKNQRYLTEFTAMWFDLADGTPTIPDCPFTLPDYYNSTRPFTKPGLRA